MNFALVSKQLIYEIVGLLILTDEFLKGNCALVSLFHQFLSHWFYCLNTLLRSRVLNLDFYFLRNLLLTLRVLFIGLSFLSNRNNSPDWFYLCYRYRRLWAWLIILNLLWVLHQKGLSSHAFLKWQVSIRNYWLILLIEQHTKRFFQILSLFLEVLVS